MNRPFRLPASPDSMTRRRVLGAGVALSAGALSGPAAAFQNEGVVRIGSIHSLTGVPSPYGIQASNGLKLGVEAVNAAGGARVGGQQIKLQITPSANGYDTGNDNALTIALLKKQILDDRVLVVVGPTSSGGTEVAFNYLNELEKEGSPIVVLSPASGAPNLGGLSPWGFRNMFFENQIVDRELALVAKQFGYRSAGVFTVTDNAYTAAMSKFTIRPGLKKHGLNVIVEAEALSRDTDFSRQVQAFRKDAPDVVFVSAPLQATVGFMKEARRRGLRPKIWLGTVGSIAPELPQIGDDAVERLVVGSSFLPGGAGVKDVQALYQRQFGHEINLFGVNGYEAAFILKAAIEAAGIENKPETLAEDRKRLREGMRKMQITSVTGESIRFDDKGDTVKQGYMLTIQGGRFVEWDAKPFR